MPNDPDIQKPFVKTKLREKRLSMTVQDEDTFFQIFRGSFEFQDVIFDFQISVRALIMIHDSVEDKSCLAANLWTSHIPINAFLFMIQPIISFGLIFATISYVGTIENVDEANKFRQFSIKFQVLAMVGASDISRAIISKIITAIFNTFVNFGHWAWWFLTMATNQGLFESFQSFRIEFWDFSHGRHDEILCKITKFGNKNTEETETRVGVNESVSRKHQEIIQISWRFSSKYDKNF